MAELGTARGGDGTPASADPPRTPGGRLATWDRAPRARSIVVEASVWMGFLLASWAFLTVVMLGSGAGTVERASVLALALMVVSAPWAIRAWRAAGGNTSSGRISGSVRAEFTELDEDYRVAERRLRIHEHRMTATGHWSDRRRELVAEFETARARRDAARRAVELDELEAGARPDALRLAGLESPHDE